VGAIYRVHHSTVSRWMAEVRESVLAATARALMDELGIGAAECRSLMRVVHTNLDLTLSRWLRATPGLDAPDDRR
jgi:RNA polymerase sigma-70 factor (ECF subfamily)